MGMPGLNVLESCLLILQWICSLAPAAAALPRLMRQRSPRFPGRVEGVAVCRKGLGETVGCVDLRAVAATAPMARPVSLTLLTGYWRFPKHSVNFIRMLLRYTTAIAKYAEYVNI